MIRIRIILPLLAGTLLLGCSGEQSEKGVELAMQRYDRLIQKMDADSIALLYTPDGDLGNMAHGRDSIRSFLSRFKDVEVLYQHSITTYLKVSGDSAVQRGIYHQEDRVGGRDTSEVEGEFSIVWKWEGGRWLIKNMSTKSGG